jgi:2,5-diketo-D-gluconate reductase B
MRKWAWLIVFLIGGIMDVFASSKAVEVDSERGVCLIDGLDFPIVGFGTYPLTGQVCTQAVEQAVEIGYQIIDTATYYRNFDGIAKALKNLDRRRLYIISKVWYDQQAPEALKEDLEATLTQLEVEYLDAYLLHWPNSQIPIEKTLMAMEELRMAKKIRHIGLSNVTVNHVKRAIEIGIPITWVQVEMHPQFFDPVLIDYCQERSIVVQAWAPLGRGRISQDSVLTKIGEKHSKTASQVAIRWIIQHGCVPLPGSKNEGHIRENSDVNDFVLSQDDMEEIDRRAKLGKRERFTKEQIGLQDEFDFTYENCWPNEDVLKQSLKL